MKEDFDKHITEYAVLLMFALVMGTMFYYFRYNHQVLVFLTVVCSFAYSLWGIIHHKLEGRLTKLIAAEYILFGFLVFFLLYIVLNFV